jgi:hypothetical protein
VEDGLVALAGAITRGALWRVVGLAAGYGVTALRRRPAPCVPTLRQRAWAAAPQRRDSLANP